MVLRPAFLEKENMSRLVRKAEIPLEYQNYIETPPASPAQLYGQACSNDSVTIESWRPIWIANVRANHKTLGSFKDHSVGKLFGILKHKPAILAGSGPSLKHNGIDLKKRGDLTLLSCLHNFHFFEDNDVPVDFYVSLDAGPIVLDEIAEGGKLTQDEYWERTKGKKLIAFIGSDPNLFRKWQGEIYLFSCPIPDAEYTKAVEEVEQFHTYITNGGNVLGACLYIAKGIMGANPIAFVGADFSFSYDKKFHGWDSQYDARIGNVMKAIDVFGNKVLTWPSYNNFKCWFDFIAIRVPGIYINCTEGGCFGAYGDGNIMAVKQMKLIDFIEMYEMHEKVRGQCENPSVKEPVLLF